MMNDPTFKEIKTSIEDASAVTRIEAEMNKPYSRPDPRIKQTVQPARVIDGGSQLKTVQPPRRPPV